MSVRKQCQVLNINRSSFYYQPKPEKEENIRIMNIMDRHLSDHPTEGVMSMVYWLRDLKYAISPKRVRRLLRKMGYEAIYKKRNLSKLGLKEYIYPYLLKNLGIERVNQVWSIDITYIPMAKGFMYLTGIIDVYSRKMIGWGISNSLEAKSVMRVLQEAISKNGKPEIINSDQGSQFTCPLWVEYLKEQAIQISMDGKGRATDNVWIERFWKSLKYNYVYLNPCENGLELYQGISKYIDYYNNKVHHTTKQTPENRYTQSITNIAA